MTAWIAAHGIEIAVAATVIGLAFADRTVRQLRGVVNTQALEIAALRERVGLTHDDVEAYLAMHPDFDAEED
jgi:hypothetical protein